jgi:glycine cleavage system regulatory protein
MRIPLGLVLLTHGHMPVLAAEIGTEVRIRSGPITGEQREGATVWPRYTADDRPHLVLDTQITVSRQLRQEACDLLAPARGL